MTENDLSHLHAKAVNTNPSPPKQIIYLFIYLFEIKKQSKALTACCKPCAPFNQYLSRLPYISTCSPLLHHSICLHL